MKNLLSTANIWGLHWIVSSQMTKTFRDNYDTDVQMQLRMYFFVPFVHPCMHHNYGVISGSHACRDCVWPVILDEELYTPCPRENC